MLAPATWVMTLLLSGARVAEMQRLTMVVSLLLAWGLGEVWEVAVTRVVASNRFQQAGVVIGTVTGKGTNRGALAFYKTYNPKANGWNWFDIKSTEVGRRDLPSRVYLRESVEFIIGNKWKTLDIIYAKASKIFARGWDSFVMKPLTGGSGFLSNLLPYAYLPVMILGFIGMIRFGNDRNRLIMLPTLSYLVFFVLLSIFKIRYRLLAEPALIIFASITIGRICGLREYEDTSTGSSIL